MIRARAGQGIESGIVAAAATAGALVGFARAHGDAFAPFNAIAGVALGGRAYVIDGFDARVTLAGIVVYVIAVTIWGLIFGLVAASARGLRLLAAALGFAGVAALADFVALPVRFRPGLERVLSVPELVIVYLVLALGLALGIWIARPAAARA